MVKSMLSHDPEERPETTDVLTMEFMAADAAAADDSEAVSHFRRQRRKTASTESEE